MSSAARKRGRDGDDLIEKALTCPVCLGIIPPPVQQCSNGHVICVECNAKCSKCPICRIPGRAKIRNLALENIAEDIMFKCPHVPCNEKVKHCAFKEHLQTCPSRPFVCLIPGCSCFFSPTITAYTSHLRDHGVRVVECDAKRTCLARFTSKHCEDVDVVFMPVLIFDDGLFYHLDVFLSGKGFYMFSLCGIGSNDHAFKIKIGRGEWMCTFQGRAGDILLKRRSRGVGALYVSREYAHFCSGTSSESKTVELCLQIELLH